VNTVPPDIENRVAGLIQNLVAVEGQLTPREIRCLALFAAMPTTHGDMLEIGSFKGRSTIALATASAWSGQTGPIAVDPLTSPADTDPDLRGASSARDDFERNLGCAGVLDRVEFHQMFSSELASRWPSGRKLRLLWIDGDHSYRGTKTDFDLFRAHLAPGAVVAFHDVLHGYPGPTRVMAEDVLLSSDFGPAGVCGSIGWSQYLPEGNNISRFGKTKEALYRRLCGVLPWLAFGQKLHGLDKLRFKIARSLVPHGDIQFEAWLRTVVLFGV
jgi:predicted O-methyltransferase YrrM